MVLLAKDAWHDNFVATATKEGRLSARTIATYHNNLKSLRLKLFSGIPTSIIFLMGDEAAAVLTLTTLRGDLGNSTLKAYVTALKGVYNAMAPAALQAKVGAQKAAWDEAERALRDRANAAMEAHKATKKQVLGYVPWAEIVACREGLPLDSKERLLFGMYTLVPPLRIDYADVKVIHMDQGTLEEVATGEPCGKGAYLALSIQDPTASYIRVPHPSKVSSYKRHGITTAVPLELHKTIVASLEAHPRSYLFTTARSDRPYSAESFQKWVTRTLQNCLGHTHINNQHLRRSYVVAMYHRYCDVLGGKEGAEAQQHAEEQIRRAAHCMAHSVSMHNRYRFTLDEHDVPEQLEMSNLSLPVLPWHQRQAAVFVEPF